MYGVTTRGAYVLHRTAPATFSPRGTPEPVEPVEPVARCISLPIEQR